MASSSVHPLDRLAEEFLSQVRAGKQPSLDDVARAHPELGEQIRQLFPMLLQLEQARPTEAQVSTGFSSAAIPARLGDYRILRQVGRGGMGVVYEAVQESLGRHVALKVLPPTMTNSAEALERFRREARSAAQLHHSNIVPVHEVGVARDAQGVDFHYYAMQFIHGQPLDLVLKEVQRLRAQPAGQATSPVGSLAVECAQSMLGQTTAWHEPSAPSSSEPARRETPVSSTMSRQEGESYYQAVARLGVQAARGLAYAHSQGVLHRDIKPANLLLDAQGTLWLADFGLAKMEHDVDMTTEGGLVGTLRYMAPERFTGLSTTHTDIYSLGTTLYEMLTLRPVFEETDRLKLIEQINQHQFPLPRQVNAAIPADLETIVLKAMAREAGDRYRQADELADDLERYLTDRPIQARRHTWSELAWRWSRRNPVAATLASGLAAALFSGTLISAILGYLAVQRKNEAEYAEATTRQAQFEAEQNLARSYLRPLGYNQQECDPAEMEGLIELASSKEERVRWLFVREAMHQPAVASRFIRRTREALQAAIGTSPGRRKAALDEARSILSDGSMPIACRTAALCVILELGDSQITQLKEVVGYLLEKQELHYLARLSLPLGLPHDELQAAGKLLAEHRYEAPPEQQAAITMLLSIANQLKPQAAQEILATAVKHLIATQQDAPYLAATHLHTCTLGVRAMVLRLPPAQRESLLQDHLKLLIRFISPTTGNSELGLVGQDISLIVPLMTATDTNSNALLVQCIESIIKFLSNPRNEQSLHKEICAALAICLVQVETGQERYLREACSLLVRQLLKIDDVQMYSRMSVLNCLQVLLPHVDANRMSKELNDWATVLVEDLEQPVFMQRCREIARGVMLVTLRMKPADAHPLRVRTCRALINRIKRERSRAAMNALPECLRSLQGSQGGAEIHQWCEDLMGLMARPLVANEVNRLGESLVELFEQLPLDLKQTLLPRAWQNLSNLPSIPAMPASVDGEKPIEPVLCLLMRLDPQQAKPMLVKEFTRLVNQQHGSEWLGTLAMLHAIRKMLPPNDLYEPTERFCQTLLSGLHDPISSPVNYDLFVKFIDGVRPDRQQVLARQGISALLQIVAMRGILSSNAKLVRPENYDGIREELGYAPALLTLETDRHVLASYLKHPGCLGDLRDAILARLEQVCVPPSITPGIHWLPSPAGLLLHSVELSAWAATIHTQRRFRNTWDVVSWFEQHDPGVNWKSPSAALTR